MVQLGAATWSEVDDAAGRAGGPATVLVPVGALEQHGPHLPLDTDSVIAGAVADGLARRLQALGDETWVAPVVAFGASGEHQDFPGTVSVGAEALRLVLVELARSLRTWAGRVVLVNGHGGNRDALVSAVTQLRRERHEIGWVPCAAPGMDAHAGRAETSLMMHLRPGSVRSERLEPGRREPVAQLLPALRDKGVRAVSRNGVLGDPSGASAAEGARLLAEMVRRARARVEEGADSRPATPRGCRSVKAAR